MIVANIAALSLGRSGGLLGKSRPLIPAAAAPAGRRWRDRPHSDSLSVS